MELQLRTARGAKIERPEQTVRIPQLATIMDQLLTFKREQQSKYEAKWSEKFKKMDELIAAVKGIEPGGQVDLGPVMKMMADIQKDHKRIAAEHAAMKASKPEEHEEHEPCEYKLTGKRMANGLIDIEAGLIFTPIGRD
jgi:hypothetical protein